MEPVAVQAADSVAADLAVAAVHCSGLEPAVADYLAAAVADRLR